MCRSPSPIAEVGVIEYRFEDRLKTVEQRLLAYAIVNRRYAELAELPRFADFRDRDLPDRLRLIGPRTQFCLQSVQMLVRLVGKVCHADSIDTATAPIGPDPLPGDFQILPLINLVN
ncbi:hypothetical protein QFZ96_002436 [Paraburkholderia youngii]